MRRIIIVVLLGLAGCQFNPFASSFTSKQPKNEDLYGKYVLTDDSQTIAKQFGHYSATNSSITLKSDSSILLTNIPDWWHSKNSKPQGEFDSGQGSWTIERNQEWWAVGVILNSINKSPANFSTHFNLIGEKAPYIIHLSIGDPDQGLAMQFKKVFD
jgi:hypothetical protein